MLWLTASNAIDKSISFPKVYLFSLKESYNLFTSSATGCSVEWPSLIQIVYQTPNCFWFDIYKICYTWSSLVYLKNTAKPILVCCSFLNGLKTRVFTIRNIENQYLHCPEKNYYAFVNQSFCNWFNCRF